MESGGLVLARDADPAEVLAHLPLLDTGICSLGRNKGGLTLPCAAVRLKTLLTCFSPAEMPILYEVSPPAQHYGNRRSIRVQV